MYGDGCDGGWDDVVRLGVRVALRSSVTRAAAVLETVSKGQVLSQAPTVCSTVSPKAQHETLRVSVTGTR